MKYRRKAVFLFVNPNMYIRGDLFGYIHKKGNDNFCRNDYCGDLSYGYAL